MIDPDVHEPEAPPAWIEGETLAVIAATLDEQLYELLRKSSLYGRRHSIPLAMQRRFPASIAGIAGSSPRTDRARNRRR